VAASDHLSNKPVSAEPADEPRLDRTKFSVVGIDEPDDSLAYWLTRPIWPYHRYRTTSESY